MKLYYKDLCLDINPMFQKKDEVFEGGKTCALYKIAIAHDGIGRAFEYYDKTNGEKPLTGERLIAAVYDIFNMAVYGACTFDEFCKAEGLSNDSIRALKKWELCQRLSKDMKDVIGLCYSLFEVSDYLINITEVAQENLKRDLRDVLERHEAIIEGLPSGNLILSQIGENDVKRTVLLFGHVIEAKNLI